MGVSPPPPHKNAPSQKTAFGWVGPDTSDRSSGCGLHFGYDDQLKGWAWHSRLFSLLNGGGAAGNAAANLGKTAQEQLDMSADLRMAIRTRAERCAVSSPSVSPLTLPAKSHANLCIFLLPLTGDVMRPTCGRG